MKIKLLASMFLCAMLAAPTAFSSGGLIRIAPLLQQEVGKLIQMLTIIKKSGAQTGDQLRRLDDDQLMRLGNRLYGDDGAMLSDEAIAATKKLSDEEIEILMNLDDGLVVSIQSLYDEEVDALTALFKASR